MHLLSSKEAYVVMISQKLYNKFYLGTHPCLYAYVYAKWKCIGVLFGS